MIRECLICGDRTQYPWRATFWHLRLYERGQWKYLRGNCTIFGVISGIHSVFCLAFPIYNTLRYWKHRKSRLVLSDGRPLEAAFDENGCALK